MISSQAFIDLEEEVSCQRCFRLLEASVFEHQKPCYHTSTYYDTVDVMRKIFKSKVTSWNNWGPQKGQAFCLLCQTFNGQKWVTVMRHEVDAK